MAVGVVDHTVIGAVPTRWTTAGMKRADGMQGSRSEAMDERGRSLVMDGGGGISTPAWWGGEGVLAPMEYEWGKGR